MKIILRNKNKLFLCTLVGLSLFTNILKADEVECTDAALAKSNFIGSCTGYMQGRALAGGGDTNVDRIRSDCKCAAQNFHVENIANKKCDFDLSDIEISMKLPKIKVICGK